MDSRARAILKTLLYSDIFDYPLKKEEIYKFLIGENLSYKDFLTSFENTKKYLSEKQGYFAIKERERIIPIRKKREEISIDKLEKARKIVKKLYFIPTIKFIGISGALSMQNANADDDIDIFVITENNLVWFTRFILIIVLKSLGVYRSKNEKYVSDKICLNMIISENKMNFSKNKNIYTAHEIVQLIPVFNKDNTYREFLKINNWILEFMPNALFNKKVFKTLHKKISDRFWILIFNILFLEKIFKFLQFSYMKNNIKKEIVKNDFLGFHPFDYKIYVLKKYKKKLRENSLK